MKRLWLVSATLIAILPAAALAQALPPQARGAAQAQQQRQQQPAPVPGQDRDIIAEDVRAGRLTQAQAEQLGRSAEAARRRIAEANHSDAIRRELERDGSGGVLDQANRTFDAASDIDIAGGNTARQFGQNLAETMVGGAQVENEMQRLALQSQASANLERQILQESAAFARERAEMIRSNPNASQNDRLQADFEARTIDRYARTVEERRAADLQTLNRQAQRLRDAKARVELEAERLAEKYGTNPKDWPPQGGQVSQPARAARAATQPPPPPAPIAPPPPDPLSAPPPPAQAQPRPVKKGVVPGANGDPFEGFRVSQAQGGSGAPDPQPPRADTAAQERAAQAARDEAMAQRIADSRQAAMDAARETRDQLDQAWNAPTQFELEQEALQRQASEMLDELNRMGNLGGGGAGGGEGFSGLDSQLADGSGFVEDWGSILPDWQDWPADDAFDAGAAFDEMLAEYRAIEAETVAIMDSWRSFEAGGTLTAAELLPIYQGWDPMTAPIGSSGRSLSAAGTSVSSVGTSLSSAGTSLSSVGTSLSSSGTSLSSLGTSLSSAGSPIPPQWSYTPSSAPQGLRVDWGGGFSPTDPFRVSTSIQSQFRPRPDADQGPSLCGR